MKHAISKIFLLLVLSIQCVAQNQVSIKTEINPGSELITIMLWMSGKYSMPMDSNYKSDVENIFQIRAVDAKEWQILISFGLVNYKVLVNQK